MKKGPAKKKALTPKRKYTKRKGKKQIQEKINMGGGEDQLFKIQEFSGALRLVGFRTTNEYKKMENALKKLQPKEAFVIKKEWKVFAHKIVNELQLEIKIVVIKIMGNDALVRVVRLY